jgi:hypothetical protein
MSPTSARIGAARFLVSRLREIETLLLDGLTRSD